MMVRGVCSSCGCSPILLRCRHMLVHIHIWAGHVVEAGITVEHCIILMIMLHKVISCVQLWRSGMSSSCCCRVWTTRRDS